MFEVSLIYIGYVRFWWFVFCVLDIDKRAIRVMAEMAANGRLDFDFDGMPEFGAENRLITLF